MKKILIVLAILVSVSFFKVFAEKPENLLCPKSKSLMTVSIEKGKESLIKALEILIAEVYGSSPDYRTWRIEMINPIPIKI